MKILYLYDNYPSYRKDFFSMLSKKIRQKGNDFAFFYGSRKENASRQETDSDFDVKRFAIKETKLKGVELIRFKGFKKAFKFYKPDIVVLQSHVAILSYWWAFFYMKLHGIQYIIWDCNYTRETLNGRMAKFRRKLVDYSYIKAAVCITYGSVFKKYLIQLGRNPEEVFVAQNTINIEKIISERSSYCSKREFNHPIRVLYVGALLDRKYVDTAVIAISKLLEAGYDIYFDIVGDGPEKNRIEKTIQEQNTDGRIILHGAKHGSEVKVFFEKDDLFILPGTGGLAVNEAMAYSMPIVSTIGDDTIVDLIDGNGILLKNFGDSNEIYDALKVFIDSSEKEKERMSRRSEQIVTKLASMENMVKQHINAIEYVMSNKE